MNPNVTYNPDVGQTNQSELAYTTSGINRDIFTSTDVFQGLTKEEKADAKVMFDMLIRDIEYQVGKRMQGNSNVRY